ncbi:MAG: RluA family pseudouridine synthase [Acidovorax sp.]
MPPAEVECVYEDGDLLVLHKPGGLLCVPGRGPDKQDALSTRAEGRWPGALIVHRLDQATSGLVLMARHIEAQRRLSDAFATRRVDKRYHAIVRGQPAAAGEWNLIDLPLGADWPNRPRQKVDLEHGKPSQTLWRPLAYDTARDATRLELQPLTGRTHQLRLHLVAIGHPILGDTLYADAATQAAAPRLLLHATSLAFAHPMHGGACAFSVAPDF